MNVLLLTLGSHGDVHPKIGIGAALARRGHDVTLITNGYFEPLAKAAGLKFVELGTADEFRVLIKDPDLWHPTRSFDAVFLRGVYPLLEQSYNTIVQNYVPNQTVVIASVLGFGARIAQEKLGIPTISAHTAPSIMRTIHDVPKLPGLFMPSWYPLWLKRKIWEGGDRFVLDRKLAPAINALRAKVGLHKPVGGILRDWLHSPDLTIGMWPEWFAPRQPDWPAQFRAVGFPLYDEAGITPIDPELDAWLDDGEPPIAFTPGSAMAQGARFFAVSAQACESLGRRGLLLTRHPEQIPTKLPEGVRHARYAPFGQLLPRCAVLVHHGGIGTTAQGLRAGIPQLIMAMAHDQFDNARRVQRLGVAIASDVRKYRPASVARSLTTLLESADIRSRCKAIAERFHGTNALQDFVEQVESLAAHKGIIKSSSAVTPAIQQV